MIYAGILSVVWLVATDPQNSSTGNAPAGTISEIAPTLLATPSVHDGEFCKACGNSCPAPPGRFWASGEYLLWRVQPMNIPALVSAAPAGTPIANAGTAGDPATRNLFGGNGVNGDFRNGLRIGAGFWLDECRTCAIVASGFWLESADDSGVFSSNGSPGLFRPFFNAGTGNPGTQLVAFNGLLAGSVATDTNTRLCGFDIAVRKLWCCDDGVRLEWQAGYGQLHLRDSVSIYENLLVTAPDPNPNAPNGSRFFVQDRFNSSSTFYGPKVGLNGYLQQERVFVAAHALLGLGVNCNTIDIDGATVATLPGGAPTVGRGGLLALPTNMGRRSSADFSTVTDLGINLGYQFTDSIGVFAGYSFLYWTNVVRAGQQIDTNVNPAYLPGNTGNPNPMRPAPLFDRSDLWVHGLNVGLRLSW